MKKLSLFTCVSTALVCAAVPASFNWSPANVTLFSLDTAQARVGRPLTATSLLGLAGECIGTNTAARLQELRSELLLLEALLLGRRMSTRRTRRRAPTAPDQRSPHQPLMAGRAMGTAQDPTRTR